MINKYISFFYKTLNESIKYDKCCICLEDKCDYLTPCNHMFHIDCIIKNININKDNRCPLCRKEIKYKDF